MDEYLDDLKAGKIQFRDKWQFELKTELFPSSSSKKNLQTQEFYFFIPNSLQVNEQTYTKVQFYQDQTNLIRFKTPAFSFKELTDSANAESPLVRILTLMTEGQSQNSEKQIHEEIKLLGNIFHSALREQMADLVSQIPRQVTEESVTKFIGVFSGFCDELERFRQQFFDVQTKCVTTGSSPLLKDEFDYLDEFISISINDYLSAFLNRIRMKSLAQFTPIDQRLCKIILLEKKYREEKFHESVNIKEDPQRAEYLLYRKGLLNKFMINPLLLKTSRSSVDQRFRGFILGIPAAIAMLIFLTLYVLQGNVFLLNSQPFILITVIIYVLKDRLKEELRALSYRQAAKWFSDYTTEIRTQQNDIVLGTLQESFSFIEENKVPSEISQIRDREFHEVLETFKRPERIFYYKKTIKISEKLHKVEARFYGFSIIFRFDIHHFLSKAEDPYQTYLDLNAETLTLRKIQLPRIYHVNIIMKTTVMIAEGKSKVELKKFRLVIDKNGIKRIENF